MWLELIELGIVVGDFIYHRWVEDHPALPTAPQIQLPRTAEGSPIPIVYGQCRLRSPIVVWADNYLVPGVPYHPWNGGAFGGTPDHYSVDILFCLGVPFYSTPASGFAFPSTLLGGWAGDTPMGMTINNVASGSAAQAFYVGPSSPASTVFSFTGVYYRGTWDQSVLDASSAFGTTPATIPGMPSNGMFPDFVIYDVSSAGTSLFAAARQSNDIANIPGARGQMMLYAHIALGSSPSISGFSFEVLSLQTGTVSDLGNSLGSDADPASVIYDLLTAPWGKLGLPRSGVDTPSFQVASNTLFSELHGFSRAFEQPADADAIIKSILAQIDGVLYQEPTTGALILKLIRFDYDPNALDDINPSNMEKPGVGWYTVQGWAEVPNQVRVTYLNRADNYAEAVAVAQDPSLVVANGDRIRSVSVRFDGCCTEFLAQQLAARELAAVGRPMVKATVVVNRSFYGKRPGDVVTLTWPELGIDHMVMRIAAIDFGQLRSGKIRMQLMRDVFDQRVGAFL